jgi:hypothetical protein
MEETGDYGVREPEKGLADDIHDGCGRQDIRWTRIVD